MTNPRPKHVSRFDTPPLFSNHGCGLTDTDFYLIDNLSVEAPFYPL